MIKKAFFLKYNNYSRDEHFISAPGALEGEMKISPSNIQLVKAYQVSFTGDGVRWYYWASVQASRNGKIICT